MVAPLSLVGHVHPLLAFAAGGIHGSVGVQHRSGEEFRLLLLPDLQTNLVDRLHQNEDLLVGLETPAKVSGGRRVGNAPRPSASM